MKRWATYGPAVGLFFGGLFLWEGVVQVFGIKGFILPAPSAIATAFFSEADELWPAGIATFSTALAGLTIGAILAILAGIAAARWRFVGEGAMPMAIAANSTPIIVLAPIANSWFGLLNPASTIFVVAVLVFFPIMINMGRGLAATNAAEIELMQSYAASRNTVLRKLEFPSALPYLFSAFKVAAALALIGSIVKEYFGGPQERLGQYITLKASLFKFEEAWAAIVLASLFGMTLYLIIVGIEKRMIGWHVSIRGTQAT